MKRTTSTVVGFLTLGAGVIMLVIPGPGLLTMAAGLAILARRYVWAQRLLERVKAEIRKQAQRVRDRRK